MCEDTSRGIPGSSKLEPASQVYFTVIQAGHIFDEQYILLSKDDAILYVSLKKILIAETLVVIRD